MELRTIIFVSLFILDFVSINGRLFSSLEEEDDTVDIIDRRQIILDSYKRQKRAASYLPKHIVENITKESEELKGTQHQFNEDSNNVAFVYWKYSKSSVVFILTCQDANTTNYNKLNSKGCHSKSNFYRSDDHGEKYKKYTLSNAWIHSIYLSPVDRSFKVITDCKNKTIYLTNNEGLTFTKSKVNFSPTFIHFHHFRKEYIAAFDNSEKGMKSLYISQDTGKTWKWVAKNVINYFWAEKDIDEDSSVIYMERESNEQIKGTGYATHLYVSKSPYTVNVTNIILNHLLVPFSVFVGKEFIIVQRFEDKKLYVCHNRDKKFYPMNYYSQAKDHVHHVVLSVEHNEIILGVLHQDTTMTLYLSDHTGRNLYLMQNNILTKAMMKQGLAPKTDFYMVKGLVGTFIINKLNEGTLISHDKGHTWNKLTLENAGNEDKKSGRDLILYIRIDEVYYDFTAPILSKESAPGIILAQGYIGKVNDLTSRMLTQQYVYISTDGGYTWRQTLDHLMGYALLDGGGLIATTPLKFTIDHRITFSTDFGKSWKKVFLTNHYTRIAAIISESSSKLLVLNVFGFLQDQPSDSSAPSNTWIVWKFNFAPLFTEGKCSSNDYITWKQNKGQCVLGQTIESKRRMTNKLCLSGPSFDNDLTMKPCLCVKKDFECDFGYIANSKNSSQCVSLGFNFTDPLKICKEGSKYYVTKGYIKVYGNKCNGGVEKELSPEEKTCPIKPPLIVEVVASDREIRTRVNVDFSFEQVSGFYKTSYEWRFGDGNIKGHESYEEVKTVKHAFQKHGTYNVTLYARNPAGTTTVNTIVRVIDAYYDDVHIAYDPPALINKDCKFTLSKYVSEGIMKPAESREDTMYIWSFGDRKIKNGDISATHRFFKSGHYKIKARILDSMISRDRLLMLEVFATAEEVDLTFSPMLDDYNTLTNAWLEDFKDKLKYFFILKYKIKNKNRLILKGSLSLPTKIKMIICDTTETQNEVHNAHNLAVIIEKDINKNKPVLAGYVLHDIHILSAHHYKYLSEGQTPKKGVSINIWIYVILALLLLIAATFTFIYYKKIGKLCHSKKDTMKDKLVLHMDVPDEFIEEPGDL